MNEFELNKLQKIYSISIGNYYGVFVRNNDGVETEDSIAKTASNW